MLDTLFSWSDSVSLPEGHPYVNSENFSEVCSVVELLHAGYVLKRPPNLDFTTCEIVRPLGNDVDFRCPRDLWRVLSSTIRNDVQLPKTRLLLVSLEEPDYFPGHCIVHADNFKALMWRTPELPPRPPFKPRKG